MILTKKQADNKINILLNNKLFDLYEYCQNNRKNNKYYAFRTDLLDEIWVTLDQSMYCKDMDYENTSIQYRTALGIKIDVIIYPRLNKEVFLEYFEGLVFGIDKRRETYKYMPQYWTEYDLLNQFDPMRQQQYRWVDIKISKIKEPKLKPINLIKEEEFETIGTA